MTLAERTFKRVLDPTKKNPEAVYTTSKFGWRDNIYDSNGKLVSPAGGHNGQDIGTHAKEWKQYALEKGTVTFAGKDSSGAIIVRISYPRLGLELLYGHLNVMYVKKGQEVDENTVIGLTGKTGRATGIHLHLGVRKIGTTTWLDPESFTYEPYVEPAPIPEPEVKEVRYDYKKGEKPVIVKAGTRYYTDSGGSKAGMTQKTDYKTSINIEFVNPVSSRIKPINVYNNAGQALGWISRNDIK